MGKAFFYVVGKLYREFWVKRNSYILINLFSVKTWRKKMELSWVKFDNANVNPFKKDGANPLIKLTL